MQQVTIYDIARMADVSASTVSRVINNKSTVKKETRERILKILAENNYIPNETARGLVKQSSKMIGILITDIRTTHHTDGIYYIEQELEARGYSCLIYNTGRHEDAWVKYIRVLGQRKVDAVILMGSIYQSEIVSNAIEKYLSNIPIVICNGVLNNPNVYSLVVDERGGVTDCVARLRMKGYCSPAFLFNQTTPSNDLKRLGYEEGMARYFPDAERLILEAGVEQNDIYAATCDLLSEHPEVDSLIYSEDLMAMIGLHALTDMHRTVPDEIGVIGINNSLFSKIAMPTMTSLDNVLYDLSMNAARNVLSLLEGQHVSKKVIICTEIVERKSTDRTAGIERG